MAKNQDGVTRSNLFNIDVNLIDIPEENGRSQFARTQKEIEERAKSILEVGQLQPIVVRKVKDRYKVVAGTTRVLAIKWGNESGLFDPPIKVQAISKTLNDENAIHSTITENLERNNTSAIDDAVMQNILRERYQWKDTEIAKLYKTSSAKVGQIKKLLNLPNKIQKQIHEGTIPVSAGLLLVDSPIDPKEYDDILKTSKDDKGKVNTQAVKATLRSLVAEDSEVNDEDTSMDTENDEVPEIEVSESLPDGTTVDVTDPPAKKKKKEQKPDPEQIPVKKGPKYPRTLKEIKEYWKEQTGLVDPSPAIGDFAKYIVRYLEGDIQDGTMTKAFDRLYDAIRDEIKSEKKGK